MTELRRLFSATAVLTVVAFSFACSSDSSSDSQSVPSGNAQGMATTTSQATNTPELRPGGTPTVTASSTGSVAAVTIPFENADQARASLLGLARTGPAMDALDSSGPLDLKAYPGWLGVYPTLRLVGSGINATPMAVSVYRNILNSKDPASTSNPKVIAFAVTDTKGVCAAGVIRGFPAYTDYSTVNIGSAPCTAESVTEALRR